MSTWTASHGHAGPGRSVPVPGAVPQDRAVWTARAPAREGGAVAVASRGMVATAVWSLLWLGVWVAAPALILGWTPVAITSGSMAPLIRPGDVVLLDPDAPVEVGSVVTFPRGGGLVTHRVVAAGGTGWVTRGDANGVNDRGMVAPDDVVGAGRLVVPLVGSPARAGAMVRPSAAAFAGVTAAEGSSFGTQTLVAPTGLTATCRNSGRIDLSWVPSSSSAVTGYRIERRRNNEGSFSVLTTVAGGASASYVDTASPFSNILLVGSTTTTYRLTAVVAGSGWTAGGGQASATGTVALLSLIFSCS